jgi:hypothetical protein
MSLPVESNSGRKKARPDEKYPAQFYTYQNGCFQHVPGEYIQTDHHEKQKGSQGGDPVYAFE